MSKITDLTVSGRGNSLYQFTAYTLDTTFRAVGAVYMFTIRTLDNSGSGSHDVVYIGQTGDLSTRFEDHHKASCITRKGANCICIYLESSQETRCAIERELLANYDHPCNG
jgi:hypothetical protein